MPDHPRLRYVVPSKTDDQVFSWESQAAQYPPTGEPGISYVRGVLEPEIYVDCLLYRDEAGALVGILNYFPNGVPGLEQPGAGALFVHPDHRRQGIGTALSTEWLARWDHWDEQVMTFTDSGAAFVNHHRREYNASGHFPNYEPERHQGAPLEGDEEL